MTVLNKCIVGLKLRNNFNVMLRNAKSQVNNKMMMVFYKTKEHQKEMWQIKCIAFCLNSVYDIKNLAILAVLKGKVFTPQIRMEIYDALGM